MKLDYELIDLGRQLKRERFGNNQIIRPEPWAQGIFPHPDSLPEVGAICKKLPKGDYAWDVRSSFQKPWQITYGSLCFELRLSQSKNIGIFPEQVSNWEWLQKVIKAAPTPPQVLNLFAYTGGATLVALQAGAHVCHVDASKSTVRWASDNAALSGLKDKPVRWIAEDAMRFLRREIARGRRYDGIILDPPPFGRAGSESFEFKKQIHDLMVLCQSALVEKPLFLLFNSYALNQSPKEIEDLIGPIFKEQSLESGELTLETKEHPARVLSCSVYARFSCLR